MFKILPVNDPIEIHLPECPESPTEFWVIRIGDKDEINKLRKDLNNCLKSRLKEADNKERGLKFGEVYLTKDGDDIWRRVRLEFADDIEMELRDVDTGKLLVQHSDGLLYDLPSEFQKDFMGIQCRLSGIICKGDRLTWSQRSLEVFRKNFRPMWMRILGFQSTIHIVEVAVQDNKDLATILIQAGVAEHLDLEKGLKSLKSILSTNTCASRFEPVEELQLPKFPLKNVAKKLDAASECWISVNHVVTPNQFYANPLSNLLDLERLESEMDDHYKSHEEGKFMANIFSNLYAAKYDSRESWKRASILNFQEGKAVIFLCDYGYIKTVSIRCLVPLDQKFTTLPAQAICCSLGLEERQWQKQEAKYFSHLTLKLPVSIKIIENQKHKVVVEFISNNSIKQSMENFIKTAKSGVEKIASGRLNDASIPEKVVESRQTESRKVKNYPVNDIKLSEGDDVIVTAIETTGDFYIIKKNKDHQKFQQLMINLRNHCNTSHPITSISQSQPVACKFDKLWARASILKVTEHCAEVIFIDFGKKMTVDRSVIKEIPDCLIDFLPAQSFNCSLNLHPNYSSEIGEQWFKSNCSGSICSIQFARKEDDKYVIDIKTKDVGSVCEKILQMSETKKNWCDEMELANEEQNTSAEIQELTEGCEVIVVHIISPDDFYVQKKSEEVTEIQKKISLCLNQSQPNQCRNVEEGMLVSAQFEGFWYRAIVTEMMEDDMARVFFVDFGNELVVETRLLCDVVDEFCVESPHLAQQCRLNGSSKRSDPLLCEAFKQSCLEETYRVKNVLRDALGLYRVDMIDSETSKPAFDLNKFSSTIPNPPKMNAPKCDKLDKESGEVSAVTAELPLSVGDVVSIKYSRNPCDFYIGKNENLMQKLICQLNETPFESLGFPKEGDVVAVLFEELYCRAKILKLLPDNRLKVLFIDYGITDIVYLKGSKALPQELKDSRPVIRCRHAKITKRDWEQKYVEWFKYNCERLPYKLTSIKNSGVTDGYGETIYEVELMTEDGESLEQFINKTVVPDRSVVRLGDLGSLELDTNYMCTFLSSLSPHAFYCQCIQLYVELSTDNQPRPSDIEYKPVLGEICLVFDEVNDEWARAEVVKVDPTGAFTHTIDFDNDLEVPFIHIRVLPTRMKKFPPLAFMCSLHGVSPIGSKWTEESNDHFPSLLTDQIISVKIIGRDGDLNIVEVVDADGISVSDIMKATKLAK